MKKIILTLIVTSLAMACGEETELEVKQQEEIQAVSALQPTLKVVKDQITASGVLSSKNELKLAFKTGGMIKSMLVSEGDYVKEGQLLASLDMAEVDALVNQAQLGVQKAKRDLERVKRLHADEVATQSNLDDATTAFDLAKASLETAEFNQKLSNIYAPKTGKILMKIADQGELIVPFSPALILGNGSNTFHIKVGLTDRDIVKVQIGDKAEVKLDAYPMDTFSSRITQIAQTVNPRTGTYDVELAINGKGKKLISGFVAKATIMPSAEKEVLLVPANSLIEADGSFANVFVLKGELVEKRKVEIATIYLEMVEIVDGISQDDLLINLGANFLSDGQKVKVID